MAIISKKYLFQWLMRWVMPLKNYRIIWNVNSKKEIWINNHILIISSLSFSIILGPGGPGVHTVECASPVAGLGSIRGGGGQSFLSYLMFKNWMDLKFQIQICVLNLGIKQWSPSYDADLRINLIPLWYQLVDIHEGIKH